MPRYIDAEKIPFIKYINGSVNVEKEVIDAMPTADVQKVKHGHWFFTEYDFFDCSVCGNAYFNGCNSTAEAKKRLEKGYDLYEYCPYCGAKMDGEGK